MAELGRAALLVTLGLSLYALVAGSAAAALGRRRLALSGRLTRSSRRSSRPSSRRSCSSQASCGTTVSARVCRGALEPRVAARVQDLGVLGRPGGVAAALAPDPHRLRVARGLAPRGSGRATSSSGSRPCSAGSPWGSPGFSSRSSARSTPSPRLRTGTASTRASRTRTWSPTRSSSTSATSGSPSRSRSRWARSSPGAPTSDGSSRRGAGRSSRGRRSASGSSWARTGRTRRWAGAATTPGTPSRTPR